MEQKLRHYRDEQFWNVMFIFSFVVLVAIGYRYLEADGALPVAVAPFDAAVLVLAVMRVVRLVTHDRIFLFFRNRFLDRSVVKKLEDADPEVVFDASDSGFKRSFHHLLGCPWCSGLWVSLLFVFLFFAFPQMWILFLILAVAGVASMLQIFVNLVGWYAEGRKREVEG